VVTSSQPPIEIQLWPIDRLVFYARNPRKNDAAVDRMCASIREFGFKIPVLARSDGIIVDGHLRIKAARKLGSWPSGDVTAIPVILCDEWTEAQAKAFRLMVNRSVTWADWDEELLALELQELNEAVSAGIKRQQFRRFCSQRKVSSSGVRKNRVPLFLLEIGPGRNRQK
jgi:hypothetical protein